VNKHDSEIEQFKADMMASVREMKSGRAERHTEVLRERPRHGDLREAGEPCGRLEGIKPLCGTERD